MFPDDGKVTLRNFLEILADMAKQQTVRKWQIVKKTIEGLIAGTISPEAYSATMHKEIIKNPQGPNSIEKNWFEFEKQLKIPF